jgi:hypothetical protein
MEGYRGREPRYHIIPRFDFEQACRLLQKGCPLHEVVAAAERLGDSELAQRIKWHVAGPVLTIEYVARGRTWTERIPHKLYSPTLLQATKNGEMERVAALIDAFAKGYPESARAFLSNVNNAKYFIWRGVPAELMSEMARGLGEYTVAREITLYDVPARSKCACDSKKDEC